MTTPATDRVVMPVCWEPVEPGDEFTVRLDGAITLTPAVALVRSTLILAGSWTMPPVALTPDSREQVRPELVEASRDFITALPTT